MSVSAPDLQYQSGSPFRRHHQEQKCCVICFSHSSFFFFFILDAHKAEETCFASSPVSHQRLSQPFFFFFFFFLPESLWSCCCSTYCYWTLFRFSKFQLWLHLRCGILLKTKRGLSYPTPTHTFTVLPSVWRRREWRYLWPCWRSRCLAALSK